MKLLIKWRESTLTLVWHFSQLILKWNKLLQKIGNTQKYYFLGSNNRNYSRYNISNTKQYIKDYQQLFVKTIKKEFDRLTNNSGNFVFSSPSNGIQTEHSGYISSNPNSEYFGDGKTHCTFFYSKVEIIL